MSDELIWQVENGVGILRLNRPAVRNALNWTAQAAFAERITAVSQDPSIRVLIITGTGDKAFTTGGDLKELSQHLTAEDGLRLTQTMSAALTQITQLPIPVIAAINGDAYGGGCELLSACDIRIAALHARFVFAQVKNGVATGWGGASRLVKLLGPSRAMELLLTGRPFDVTEAHHIGLIHHVAQPEQTVMEAAFLLAEHLLGLPRHAQAALKTLVHAATHLPPEEVNALEAHLFVDLWTQPDHLEAVAAFVERRKRR